MSTKKKLFIIFGSIAVGYLLFVVAVTVAFNYIQNNPVDYAAMSYIWNESRLEEEYGEIDSVSWCYLYKSETSDTRVKRSYSVTTEKWDVRLYVVVERESADAAWQVVETELIEVIANDGN